MRFSAASALLVTPLVLLGAVTACSNDTAEDFPAAADSSSSTAADSPAKASNKSEDSQHPKLSATGLGDIALGDKARDVIKKHDLKEPKPAKEPVCADALCPPEGTLTSTTFGGFTLFFVDDALVRIEADSDDAATDSGIHIGSLLSEVDAALPDPSWTLILDQPTRLYANDNSTLLVQTNEDSVTGIALIPAILKAEGNNNPPTLFQPEALGGGSYVNVSDMPVAQPGAVSKLAQQADGQEEGHRTFFYTVTPFNRAGQVSTDWTLTSAMESAPVVCSRNTGISGVPADMLVCGQKNNPASNMACVDNAPNAVTCIKNAATGELQQLPFSGEFIDSTAPNPGPFDPYQLASKVDGRWVGVNSASGGKLKWLDSRGYPAVNKVGANWTLPVEGGADLPIDRAVWVEWAD